LCSTPGHVPGDDGTRGNHAGITRLRRVACCCRIMSLYTPCVCGPRTGDETVSAKSDRFPGKEVFVAPSREDNLPNIVIESMTCGTPVAAFDVCGMRDMIDHRHNGYLTQPFDTEDLARGIHWILGSDTGRGHWPRPPATRLERVQPRKTGSGISRLVCRPHSEFGKKARLGCEIAQACL